jgi:hypothetical protein
MADSPRILPMQTNAPLVNLAGRTFNCPCHACAFFHSRDEEFEVYLPFAKEGFLAGDKLVQLSHKSHRADGKRRLQEFGIDVETAKDKQIDTRRWEEAYLRGGRFDQDAMLELIQDVLRTGHEEGFRMSRLWANMEWALEDLPGVNDIVEYESRLNEVLPKYNDVVVCTYDLSKHSAAVVMDILRTHPHVIVGGTMQENPFYAPPAEFLKELRSRDRQH